MIAEFDLEEMKLQKSFKRLIDFVKGNGFSQSWDKVYVVEDNSIKRFFNSDKKDEIPKSALNNFNDYEKYFDENLLIQGYSWINLSLLGVLNGDLILTIEIPTYNDHLEFTSVNLSHSNSEIINRDISFKYKIVGEI